MDKKIIFSFAFLVTAFAGLNGQGVVNNASIIVENGATLFIEGNLQNVGTAQIVNNGTIEVQGDLTNASTSTLSGASTYVFSGSGNADLDVEGQSIGTVVLQKDVGGEVSLKSDVTINTELDFDNNNDLILEDNQLTLGTGASVVGGPNASKHIVANTSGQVVKQVLSGSSSFTFPVGDGTNYTPLTSAYTASGSGSISTNLGSGFNADIPCQTDVKIARSWNVSSTNVSQVLTGTYVGSDLTGSSSSLYGAVLDGGEWYYGTTPSAASAITTGTTTATNLVFTGTNVFGKLYAKVLLQGAVNGSTMRTDLNNMLPALSPNGTALNLSSPPSGSAETIPGDITDWLEIEIRNGTTGAYMHSVDAFVDQNGGVSDVCDTDKTFAYLKNVNAGGTNYILGIDHRNHLGVRTNTGIDISALTSGSPFDFSTSGNIYNAGHANTPMAVTGGGNALWGGDVNGDGKVRFTNGFTPPSTVVSSDAANILTTIGGITSNQLNGQYAPQDVNMDGKIRFTNGFTPPSTVVSSDAANILTTIGGITSNQINRHE